MMRRRSIGLALCAVIVFLVAGDRSARGEMPRNAFWLDLRLGGGVSLQGAFFPTPGIVFGARLGGRVQLGGGLSYWRFSSDNTPTASTVLFAPELEVDVFKSHDEKVGLYLATGIPLGAVIGSGDPLLAVGYRLAIGARYVPHPNLGFGIEGGAQGLFFDPGGNDDAQIHSIYVSLVGTFYSGTRKAEGAAPVQGATPPRSPPPPSPTAPPLPPAAPSDGDPAEPRRPQ